MMGFQFLVAIKLKYVDTYIRLYNHYTKWRKANASKKVLGYANNYATIQTYITITRHYKLKAITITNKYIKFIHKDNIYLIVCTGISKIDNSLSHKYSRNYKNISDAISWDNPNVQYVLRITYLQDIRNNDKLRYVAFTDLQSRIMYDRNNDKSSEKFEELFGRVGRTCEYKCHIL